MVARTAAPLLALLGAAQAAPQFGLVPALTSALPVVSPVVSVATSLLSDILGGAAPTSAVGSAAIASDLTSALTSAEATGLPAALASDATSLLGGVGNIVATPTAAVSDLTSLVGGLLDPTGGAVGGAVSDVTSLVGGVGNIVATPTAAVSDLTSLVGGLDGSLPTGGAVGGAVSDVTSLLGGVGNIVATPTAAVSDLTSLVGGLLNPTGGVVSDVTSLLGGVGNIVATPTAAVSDLTSLVGGLVGGVPTGGLALNTSGLASSVSALPTGLTPNVSSLLSSIISSGLPTGLPTGLPSNLTSLSGSITSGLPTNMTSTGSSSASITGMPSGMMPSGSMPSGGFNGSFSNPARPVSTTSNSRSASITSSSTSSSTSTVPVPTSPPSQIIVFDGVTFFLEFDINYRGIHIDLDILFKRDGDSLDDCLNTCAQTQSCAATSFEPAGGVCTFFSSVDQGSRMFDNTTDFATVISRPMNATGSNNGTNTNSNITAESLICPKYNGHVITPAVGNDSFAVGCGEFLVGNTFDIEMSFTKRQAVMTGLPLTISNCVDVCALSNKCVGTVFDIENNVCTFYSQVNYAMAMDGFDAATKVANNNGNNGNGQGTTTVTATTTSTAFVLPPGITTSAGAGSPTTYSAGAYSTFVSTVTVYSPPSASVYNGAGGNPTTVMVGGLPAGATVTSMVAVGPTQYVNSIPTAAFVAQPTVTVTITTGAGAAGAAGMYPTVTVHDCPVQTAFTTKYV